MSKLNAKSVSTLCFIVVVANFICVVLEIADSIMAGSIPTPFQVAFNGIAAIIFWTAGRNIKKMTGEHEKSERKKKNRE